MSGKEATVVIGTGDWSEASRNHPVGAFFEKYANDFDSGNRDKAFESIHPTNSDYTKPTGETFTGTQASWQQIMTDYAIFTKTHHQPMDYVIYESLTTQGGWELIGTATLFANLVGPPDDAPKVKDPRNGNEWEIAIPATFKFTIVKHDGAPNDGFVISNTVIFSDSGPTLMRLLKRGVVTPAALGLA